MIPITHNDHIVILVASAETGVDLYVKSSTEDASGPTTVSNYTVHVNQ